MKFSKTFLKLKSLGLKGGIKCINSRYKLKKLKKKYGFMDWHVNGCYECRPYKKQIVNIVNNINPSIIVDLGCGLGEIISKTKAKSKFGFDPDESVIQAARFLNPKVKFYVGNSKALFDYLDISNFSLDKKSLLISTARTNNLNKEELNEFIQKGLEYFNMILIDIYTEEKIDEINRSLEINYKIKNYSHENSLQNFNIQKINSNEDINQIITLIKK